MADSVKLDEIRPKKSEIKRNLEILGNKYSLVSLVVWYKHKRNPHDEIILVDVKEEIDYNFFTWATDLASWILRTSLSGFILWYLMFMLFAQGPPIQLFFAFGLVWWIVMKFIREVSQQVRDR